MADYIRRDIVLKIINTVNDTGGFAGCADYSVLFDAIDTMPAADIQPMAWISVDDKLSATRKTVLIYDEYEGISAGYYDSNYAKFRSIEAVYRSCNVTHWMPLPDPPKDGDKDNNVRNLTDEETAIYESWIESEAKDTGVNIMDGDTNG